jgi:hypothetical protein
MRHKRWTGELALPASKELDRALSGGLRCTARLRARDALVGGEVAALFPDGRTSLQAMHGDAKIAYFVSVCSVSTAMIWPRTRSRNERGICEPPRIPAAGAPPLCRPCGGQRPQVLRASVSSSFRRDHLEGSGIRLSIAGCSQRELAEGEVRSPAGVCHRRLRVFERRQPGALWLGYYEAEGKLIFAGKAGTAFQRDTRSLLTAFKRIERDDSIHW